MNEYLITYKAWNDTNVIVNTKTTVVIAKNAIEASEKLEKHEDGHFVRVTDIKKISTLKGKNAK
jgi:hypothetical protein